MVVAEIVNIRQETTDDEEKAFIVEFSLPQHSDTFETDPIPAGEYDKKTATQRVEELASGLVADDAFIGVEFPDDPSRQPEGGSNRREVVKYGGGAIVIGGVVAGGWLLGSGNSSDNKKASSSGLSATETVSSSPTEVETATETFTETSQSESSTAEPDTLRASFEDGTISPFNSLNSAGWRATSTVTYDGSYSLGINDTGPPNNDPDLRWTLPEVIRPDGFQFRFYEFSDQQNGAVYLLDQNDKIVTAAGTNNPGWTIRRDPSQHGETWYPGDGYERWVEMTIEFDWAANTLSLTSQDLQTQTTKSTSAELLTTNPIQSVVIASNNFRSSAGNKGNPKHMYLDQLIFL